MPDAGEPDDQVLMTRVRAGDARSLAVLVERYRRPLSGYLCRMLGAADADDVFQETFLRVVRSADRYEDGRPVRPWIYTIATNLAKNVYRSRAVRAHVELDGPAGGEEGAEPIAARIAATAEAPEDVASREELAARVREAVEKLPERGRAALVLFYFQGLRYEEVAAVLEVPLGTVKSRIHNALARLSELLAGEEAPS